jgi:hypothetical protein
MPQMTALNPRINIIDAPPALLVRADEVIE